MNTTTISNAAIEEIARTIDIPDSAYELAKKRYEDLGDWLHRPISGCAPYAPRVYPQGSFRLGTVIRPVTDEEEYDLDLGCRLERGISKTSYSQFQLKTLVGDDLEAYRLARQIENELEEHHRCWRLCYADELNFHMDVVPSIPETTEKRRAIRAALLERGSDFSLAEAVANFTGAITDNRKPNYKIISPDWNVSNSEGYARWFEARMKLASELLERRVAAAKVATIDQLPAFKWKTPLQRCVQILKRHRDIMFARSPASKPISIIITTLAARAYDGENDLAEAMDTILGDMASHVGESKPRIPNPVNPDEDFADKWETPDGQANQLEENFWLWLRQAKAHFQSIAESSDPEFITEQAQQRFGSRVDPTKLRHAFGAGAPYVKTTPKSHTITDPTKPWAE
jgi:hypothetical protein